MEGGSVLKEPSVVDRKDTRGVSLESQENNHAVESVDWTLQDLEEEVFI